MIYEFSTVPRLVINSTNQTCFYCTCKKYCNCIAVLHFFYFTNFDFIILPLLAMLAVINILPMSLNPDLTNTCFVSWFDPLLCESSFGFEESVSWNGREMKATYCITLNYICKSSASIWHAILCNLPSPMTYPSFESFWIYWLYSYVIEDCIWRFNIEFSYLIVCTRSVTRDNSV